MSKKSETTEELPTSQTVIAPGSATSAMGKVLTQTQGIRVRLETRSGQFIKSTTIHARELPVMIRLGERHFARSRLHIVVDLSGVTEGEIDMYVAELHKHRLEKTPDVVYREVSCYAMGTKWFVFNRTTQKYLQDDIKGWGVRESAFEFTDPEAAKKVAATCASTFAPDEAKVVVKGEGDDLSTTTVTL